MTLREILATVEARGAAICREIDVNGAPCLKIRPASLVGDLIPEISRFKPALLELLGNSVPAVDSTLPLPKWRGRGVLVWRESVNNDGEAPWRLVHDFGARSGVDFVESWESEIARETENLLAELDAEARRDFDDMSRHESETANKQ